MKIVTKLANSFMKIFKYLIKSFILFVKKIGNNFQLYANYDCFNNLIINSWYTLLIFGKSLNWQKKAKNSMQIDLISIYLQMKILERDK